ncbi:MAG: MBL fold metallo-hydrolase [Polyangiales bacterium]|jgi:glyoxylase-like metal-dependent hydrolase (beta-lactamase superfamily II)/rhodanese-related sulfurtransferase
MLLRQLFDHETWTYTYLLADEESGEAVLIDPVIDQLERDIKLLQELDLKLVYTLDTHAHADHITGSGLLRKRLGSKAVVGAHAGAEGADEMVDDGSRLRFGSLTLEVRATPGHTDGCVTYVTSDHKHAFTGDALFIRGTGRTDFQQGSAQRLYRSIHDKIFTLPDDTIIWPGHDYRGMTFSTVGEEKRHNPRVGDGKTEAQFVELMDHLDLPAPKKLDIAVPANLHCGIVPELSMSGDPLPERGWAAIMRTPEGVPEVPIGWVAENKGAIRMVDVREFDEAEADGMIDGVEVIPMGTVDEASKSWDKEEPVITICRSGRRSGRVALELEKLGFKRIASMRGGMVAWNNQ